jgi:dihydroorotate dehydrogenase (NAD+) catalytic subunit
MAHDLSVTLGSLTLPTPLIAASGCFGYGLEYAGAVDLASLGGVAVKGLFLEERQGHQPPRIVETPAGMINAIGLQGIGVHRFVKEKLPLLNQAGARTFVNVCGTTLDEHVEVARCCRRPTRRRDRAQHLVPEHQGRRHPVRLQPDRHLRCRQRGEKATHLPVIPKLTPNVTDVASFARAAEDAGADAVSLVNTFLAMAIDVKRDGQRSATCSAD